LKRDGTRAETRFCLSAKRTSPFKSAGGASVQSITGSRGVRISGSNAGYIKFRVSEEYWLPTPFTSFPFTSSPVRHRVPSHFNWTLPLLPRQLISLSLPNKNLITVTVQLVSRLLKQLPVSVHLLLPLRQSTLPYFFMPVMNNFFSIITHVIT